jgi:hypothetical protein
MGCGETCGRGTRGWKTLQVGVDHASVIVAQALTEATVDDATTGVELVEIVTDNITRVTADAAYDTVAFYTAASARGATVVVPPAKTARVSRRHCQVRHRRADRATRSAITTRLGHIIVGVSRASFC